MAQRTFSETLRQRGDKLLRYPPSPPRDLAPPQQVGAGPGGTKPGSTLRARRVPRRADACSGQAGPSPPLARCVPPAPPPPPTSAFCSAAAAHRVSSVRHPSTPTFCAQLVEGAQLLADLISSYEQSMHQHLPGGPGSDDFSGNRRGAGTRACHPMPPAAARPQWGVRAGAPAGVLLPFSLPWAA